MIDDDPLFGDVPPIEEQISRGEIPVPKGTVLRGDVQLTPQASHVPTGAAIPLSKGRGRPKKLADALEEEGLSLEGRDKVEAEFKKIDHDALRETAREKILARKKAAEEARLAKLYELEVEAELNEDPHEEMVAIVIDLPGNTDHIKLDTQFFRHGHAYEVKRSVFDYLAAQVQASWRHEDEIGSANRDIYQRPRNITVNGRTGTAYNVPQRSGATF